MTTQSKGGAQKLVDSPCAEEHKASLKCLERANYDKTACQEFFDQYKDCKRRETETRRERRLAEQAAKRR